MLGDLIQGGTIKPLLIEKPGTGFAERFLLQAILFLAIKPLQAGIAGIFIAQLCGLIFSGSAVHTVCNDIESLPGGVVNPLYGDAV